MPKRRPRRKQAGKGPVLDFFKKAHNWIKANKLISRGANTLAPIAGPYSGTVSNIGRVAGVLGYGKPRGRRPKRK